ncbi:MAG: UDP-N-acetylmuramate--L-alanine ligase [Spirochaetae bacterium HGW-Spirochaetae-7]|nr:MAG: UDP-N-acetylmuramate--L-alanine ligase [Spirochaetae bacterium HGW-Spirochaetae-7]
MKPLPVSLPADLAGVRIHLVGAKGTGVCALAELLVGAGAAVSGSDVEDIFYTDEVLAAIGVPVHPFSQENVGRRLDLVIHSAAYRPDTHPEIIRAHELGIPVMTYPEALGSLSSSRDSSGICGVHGKTTTTAMAGILARSLRLPAAVLVGSAVGAFGGRSTLTLGGELLIAETCEYRRHFLCYKPRRIVLTSVEPDHQDYYPDYESIALAFVEYLSLLPSRGIVVYCSDDPGATDVWNRASLVRPDLRGIPYGFQADGPFGLESYRVKDERGVFGLRGLEAEWRVRIPGRHIALDATAAIALCAAIIADRNGTLDIEAALGREELASMAAALESFTGSRRRSEVLGEAGGVLFMDDYGHHPTAIRKTLAGLREFYPGRRLVVDFMSHTCSRTRALLDDFATSFGDADLAVLHRIYPSAREAPDPGMTGRVLFDRAVEAGANAAYFEEPLDAFPSLNEGLRPGDLFVTMGAGDNWRLGKALFEAFSGADPTKGSR